MLSIYILYILKTFAGADRPAAPKRPRAAKRRGMHPFPCFQHIY